MHAADPESHNKLDPEEETKYKSINIERLGPLKLWGEIFILL